MAEGVPAKLDQSTDPIIQKPKSTQGAEGGEHGPSSQKGGAGEEIVEEEGDGGEEDGEGVHGQLADEEEEGSVEEEEDWFSWCHCDGRSGW